MAWEQAYRGWMLRAMASLRSAGYTLMVWRAPTQNGVTPGKTGGFLSRSNAWGMWQMMSVWCNDLHSWCLAVFRTRYWWGCVPWCWRHVRWRTDDRCWGKVLIVDKSRWYWRGSWWMREDDFFLCTWWWVPKLVLQVYVVWVLLQTPSSSCFVVNGGIGMFFPSLWGTGVWESRAEGRDRHVPWKGCWWWIVEDWGTGSRRELSSGRSSWRGEIL